MESKTSTPSTSKALAKSWKLRALLAVSLIWLGPTLACGSFAPRPTPTPTEVVVDTPAAVVNTPLPPTPIINLNATEAPTVAPATPTPAPTATLSTTVAAENGLAVGQPARVTAPDGLNLRDKPTKDGELLLRLPNSQKVKILEGPTAADNLRWWKVDDGQGNTGWVIDSDGETQLLSPQSGQPEPVDRGPRVGDRVQVTMQEGQLSVRQTPGTDAKVVARVDPGQQFTVTGGPQRANGYTWYQIRSDDGAVEGWAADGDGTDRWLSPLE